jgi:hypothetical protein
VRKTQTLHLKAFVTMKISATVTILAALLALPACDGGDKSTTDDASTTGSASDTPATEASATETPTTETPTTGDETTATPTTGDETTATGALSFAADVWDPILSPKCSCHIGPSGGLTMGADAATAYAALVGVKSTGAAALNYVTAGDSAASYIINKLEGTQVEAGGGGGMMPQGGMLSADEIATIAAWIDEGAAP